MAEANQAISVRALGTALLELPGNKSAPDAFSAPKLRFKTRALLFYLALEERAVSRQELTELFWPGGDSANLRMALQSLRSLPGASTWLAHGQHVGVRAKTDVAEFERAVAERNFRQALEIWEMHGQSCDPANRLLPGYDSTNLPDDLVEMWLKPKREHVANLYLRALFQVALECESEERVSSLAAARRIVKFDPLHESAHRLIMRLELANGNHNAVLTQYELAARVFREELGATLPSEFHGLAQKARDARETLVVGDPKQAGVASRSRGHAATPFIGRAQEVRALQALLADPHKQLVTIVGTGGVGKSRLVSELVRLAEVTFPGGVVHLDLETLRQPTQILERLVAEYGLSPVAVASGQLAQLTQQVEGKRCLIVLDAFEHFVEDAEIIDQLVEATGATVLVASRERLRLRREWVFELMGLSATNAATGDFTSSDAAQLFLELARRATPGFELTTKEHEPFMRLWEFVAGLPLYLEHLASETRDMPLAAIADELHTNLGLFAEPFRDLPARQQSLFTVLGRSWQHLATEQQVALGRLSYFVGGFTAEGARYVAGTSPELLADLVHRSFLRVGQTGRYAMHEVHATFARLAISESQRVDAITGFIAYMSSWLLERATVVGGPADPRTIVDVRTELPNIEAFWQRAATAGQWRTIEDTLAMMYSFYSSNNQLDGLRMYSQLAQAVDDSAPKSFVGLLDADFGSVLTQLGQYAEAVGRLEAAVPLLRAVRHTTGLASALSSLTACYVNAGRFEHARAASEEALEAYRQVGSLTGEANALNNLGAVVFQLGNTELAIEYRQQSVALCRSIGNRQGQANALVNLGEMMTARGLTEEARAYLAESLSLAKDLDDRRLASYALMCLGRLDYAEGDRTAAGEHIEHSLQISRALGDTASTVLALLNLGDLAMELGEEAAALAHLEEAHQKARGSGHRMYEVHAARGLARLRLTQGDRSVGLAHLLDVIGIYRELGAEQDTLSSLASLLMALPVSAESVALLRWLMAHPNSHADTVRAIAAFLGSLSTEAVPVGAVAESSTSLTLAQVVANADRLARPFIV